VIRRTLAGLLLLATVAGCGFSTVPTPGATGVASAPPPSVAPTDRPASAPPDTPEPSVDRHGVPDLEALLPARVGDVAMERLSLTGHDFYLTGTDQTRAQLDAMLGRLGKSVADLTVADAGDPTGLAVLEVGVLRVAGAPADRLLAEWVASNEAAKPGQISHAQTTVDGRALTRLVDATRPVGGTTLVFAKGDMLFLVAADDPTLVSSALAQLPTP
jgi:hypothetical protein